ncbi:MULTISPECIES: hypothetical protein [Salinivibrio]|jgi:hypothetical protein|uniref:Uncharacterized protein n=2 Tax=Salinivibrio TaxID=51366 RepID=A0ABY7LJ16_9GAMM|nr:MULTISPECIES: hypothetical protein [Salinivibrio]ODQ01463.1 hypothetical protein BGK46_02035 [Salinivibrio sp. DV]OOF10553.1 hypothetical protein BZG82_07225 [Salinivibrio sp. PR5]OOF11410.1 hypothetical protein BZG83_12560 [Salinivibrio sp. PR919]OOF17636.1 hypothetical protein BZG84_06580 [Salinivibrio sp. PR932]OOF27504.1 hypothetical protein BZJ19_01640 [Salinivibrio proteolyticus]
MPTSINSQPLAQQYMQRQRDRQDDQVNGGLNNSMSVQERAELIRKEREEQKEAAASGEQREEKRDYQSLIDRVAEQEAQKSKMDAYNQRQQALMEQVEKTITPNAQQTSYSLKV